MSRRGTAEKRTAKSDPIFRNRLVNMVVNRIMKDGKKSLAYQILYRAVKKIQQKTETNPLLVLRQAIRRVTPNIGVKTRRLRILQKSKVQSPRSGRSTFLLLSKLLVVSIPFETKPCYNSLLEETARFLFHSSLQGCR